MDNSQEATTNTIDLHRLLVLFRQHIKFIILWILATGIIGFAVAEFVVVPKYTATTEILVNQKHANNNNGQAYNDQQADVQMINTYKDIITNQVILGKVSHQLNGVKTEKEYGRTYDMTADQLKSAIKISNQQNSQVFSVAVTTNDAQESAAAANTIAQVFKKQVKKIMSINNVTIVSRAAESARPSFPNIKLFTLAGAVLGLLISVIYLIIKEMLNTAVNDDEFMTQELGLTNLGHINHFHMNHQFKANRRRHSGNHTASRRV